MKLTPIARIILQAVVNVAERPPGLRGPWRFDEAELQGRAKRARIFLNANDQGDERWPVS